ncbi:MAG: hypothetical protein K2W95_00785 [Candidatus Obscuribacterales bacterium]|nr:hypothetical protein [Candidatus Obscuribacterales bacterium]
MIDLGLIAIAKKAVAAKPRKYVTAAHVVAVAMQESHGVPYFNPFEAQYRANLRAACRITGMSESEIRKLIVFPQEINGWKVPSYLVNKFAKFRCEPGYWKPEKHETKAEAFYQACSFGIGQLMAPHLKGDTNTVKRFAADVNAQALWIAGMMEQLLTAAKGDLKKAYAGYNSGNINSKRADVLARCVEVEKFHAQAAKQIDAFNNSTLGSTK